MLYDPRGDDEDDSKTKSHLMELSIMPCIKYFCNARKHTTTGTIASIAQAAAVLRSI